MSVYGVASRQCNHRSMEQFVTVSRSMVCKLIFSNVPTGGYAIDRHEIDVTHFFLGYAIHRHIIYFLIHLLRGLTRVKYTTNKSHPCHSIVSLTRNNTTRMLRFHTHTHPLPNTTLQHDTNTHRYDSFDHSHPKENVIV